MPVTQTVMSSPSSTIMDAVVWSPTAPPKCMHTESTVPSVKGFFTPGAWVRSARIMSWTFVALTRQVEDCASRSFDPENFEYTGSRNSRTKSFGAEE